MRAGVGGWEVGGECEAAGRGVLEDGETEQRNGWEQESPPRGILFPHSAFGLGVNPSVFPQEA